MTIARWSPEERAAIDGGSALDDLDEVAALVLDGIAGDEPIGWARRAPCPVVGVVPAGSDPPPALDVVVADEGELGSVIERIEANPAASGVLVDVLRVLPEPDVPAGLVVESIAYSMLMTGPEHRAWLAAQPERSPGTFARPAVRVEREGGRLAVVLDRSERRNAFSAEVRDGLVAALAVAEADDTIDEIVLSGEGPVFSSGGDLAEFGRSSDVVRAHEIRTLRSVGAAVHRLAGRVTVRLTGACVGAGVELSAFAGRVVAAPDTTLRLPEVGMGLIPGAGGTVSVSRRIGRHATARFALSGAAMPVEEALRLGLVDEISPAR